MKKIQRFFTAESYTTFFIVLNTVSLFFLAHVNRHDPSAPVWRAVEYLCVVYFVFEAIFKIYDKGFKAYWGNGWDRFDFLVVLFSLPVLATPVMSLDDFRVVTLLRASRLFRLFRLLHMVPNRVHLAKGIGRAMKASVGIFLGLFLLNLILSLGATILFRHQAPEQFGNPFISLYTLFKVFTVEGWHEIPDNMVLGSADGWWTAGVRLFFSACVLICGILGLSMANAVFVDQMVMDNNDALEAKVDQLSRELRDLRRDIHLLTRPGRGDP